MFKNKSESWTRVRMRNRCVVMAGLFLLIICSPSLTIAQVSKSIIPDTTLPGGNNSLVLSNGSRVEISGGQAAGPEGVSGTVNVQGTTQNLSESIAPLPEGIIEVAALYYAHCAGQKNGKFSSFSLKGLDRVPHVPGELFPAPLSLSDLPLSQSRQSQTISWPMTKQLQLRGLEAVSGLTELMAQYQMGCPS